MVAKTFKEILGPSESGGNFDGKIEFKNAFLIGDQKAAENIIT